MRVLPRHPGYEMTVWAVTIAERATARRMERRMLDAICARVGEFFFLINRFVWYRRESCYLWQQKKSHSRVNRPGQPGEEADSKACVTKLSLNRQY